MAGPICRFARASRCRRLRELAAWGHDEVAKQTYRGLRAHLRICWPGVIVDGRLAPANLSDLAMAEDLLSGARGWVLADRSYGSPRLAVQLAAQGGWLLAPPRGTRPARQRPPPWLVRKRRRVETSSASSPGRYQLKRVWARDAWHLWSRWQPKLLSHTWPSTCVSEPVSVRSGSPTSSPNNPHTGLATSVEASKAAWTEE